jgi:hypothetical protein
VASFFIIFLHLLQSLGERREATEALLRAEVPDL